MTKRGRPKNIKTPEELWQHFLDYKKKIKDNPIRVQDFVGGVGKQVNRLKERPLTLEGFENHCFEVGVLNDIQDYLKNKEGRYTDFAPICSRIKHIIRQDQIEGGMSGIYNPSITQRLNGLVEKSANDNTGEVTIKVKYERKGDNTIPTTSEPTEDN
jgi:hypothetical protein